MGKLTSLAVIERDKGVGDRRYGGDGLLLDPVKLQNVESRRGPIWFARLPL
jgi:hypothetical protein